MTRKNNFSTLPEGPDLYILFIIYFKFKKFINQGTLCEIQDFLVIFGRSHIKCEIQN